MTALQRLSLGSVLVILLGQTTLADVPYPACGQCPDPYDYASYLFLPQGSLPNDFVRGSSEEWKFKPQTGLNVVGAWSVTTGRPDVVGAVLDSGILWDEVDVAAKVALNIGELPRPSGCADYDCNHDGVVNVRDFSGAPDLNWNGFVDGQDLIRFFSDGVDDDGNGYVDDIAGWDFFEDDNDPFDDVQFGHGTGQALDQAAEANNGAGFPGVAPGMMFLPLRVSDSFMVIDTDFAAAVVYAVDRRVSLISEALGSMTASQASQAAIDYAYENGVPIVASAADEQARHHNFPSGYEHTIWVNSIRNGDGAFVTNVQDYTLLNGCTNYGGQAWVSVSSTSCSSEATGRAAGLVALLVSRGKNLVDRGLLAPYPGLETPFSAEEVRQILRWSAEDIDHSANLTLGMNQLLQYALSVSGGPLFRSVRFPTQAGWDQYTGYGRPDASRLVAVNEQTVPPEADLSGGLDWFAVVDPEQSPVVPVVGTVAAVRAPGLFEYRVEVGCGCQPVSFSLLASGASDRKLERAVLGEWSPAATAAQCGFDPGERIEDPEAHSVTLRLRVIDNRGNVGEDRRTVAIHSDPDLRFPPLSPGASCEASPVLADLNRDGVLDLVYATSDGATHVVAGATGRELRGFPAWTYELPVHPSPAYVVGRVSVPREPILASPAADDLDGDGRVEIVVASTEGRVYVFDDHGQMRPGFPVSTDPALSLPVNRDSFNDPDPGIVGAPTLADLDKAGVHPDLEIIAAAMDGHIYAWRANGETVAGFPVRLADPAKMAVVAQGRAFPRDPQNTFPLPTKILGSPAVGDLDGDGFNEIVAATSEQYANEADVYVFDPLFKQFAALGTGDVSVDVMGRVYVVHHDGNLHPGGAFRQGWPAPVPVIMPGFLPRVGTGIPGSPALADLTGSGELTVAIFSALGPVVLFDPDGFPVLGTEQGARKTLASNFPSGIYPAGGVSADAPFSGLLGSGAFGDITGDGLAEYVAPTAGVRIAVDIRAPASQEFSDFQVTAWDPRSGNLLPDFPRIMEDMSFLTSPSLADVDGDGKAEIIQGSGSYLLRAFRADGKQPAGWPKFTNGWIMASPVAGDLDGDNLIEVVAATREGKIYVWDTPAPAVASAIPWQGFGRDRRHTQNLGSGVSPLAAERDAIELEVWLRKALREVIRLAPKRWR